jgi:hypothetical protein
MRITTASQAVFSLRPLATGVMGPTTTTTRRVTIPMKVGPSIPFPGFASDRGLGKSRPLKSTGPMSINKRAYRLGLRRYGCTTLSLSESHLARTSAAQPLAISVSYSLGEARLRILIVSTRDSKPGFLFPRRTFRSATSTISTFRCRSRTNTRPAIHVALGVRTWSARGHMDARASAAASRSLRLAWHG